MDDYSITGTPEDEVARKEPKLWFTIILCIVAGYFFCTKFGLPFVYLFLVLFIFYISYQVFFLLKKNDRLKKWRLMKLSLWALTALIGLGVQGYAKKQYQASGNLVVQAIEAYYDEHHFYPKNEDFELIARQTQLESEQRFIYTVFSDRRNDFLLSYHDPNILFALCNYQFQSASWKCHETR